MPPGVTRKTADGTEVTEGGHDEIRPIFQEEFADHGVTREIAERAWHWVLEKGADNTRYPILDEENLLMGYQNIPVASKGAKKNLAEGGDLNIKTL